MKTERFIKKWEKDRRKGKKKYVLTTGISMGTAMFVGNTVARIIRGNFFDQFVEYYVYIHLAYLIGGFIGGVIGSNLKWDWNEEKYNELTNRTN